MDALDCVVDKAGLAMGATGGPSIERSTRRPFATIYLNLGQEGLQAVRFWLFPAFICPAWILNSRRALSGIPPSKCRMNYLDGTFNSGMWGGERERERARANRQPLPMLIGPNNGKRGAADGE